MASAEENHIEILVQEVAALRLKVKALVVRVGEAEAALSYYADPTNWKGKRDIVLNRTRATEINGDFGQADNDVTTTIGGARARKHFQKYEILDI